MNPMPFQLIARFDSSLNSNYLIQRHLLHLDRFFFAFWIDRFDLDLFQLSKLSSFYFLVSSPLLYTSLTNSFFLFSFIYPLDLFASKLSTSIDKFFRFDVYLSLKTRISPLVFISRLKSMFLFVYRMKAIPINRSNITISPSPFFHDPHNDRSYGEAAIQRFLR